MPVIDHAVHKKTKFDDTTRYGCHNRKDFVESYYAPNRRAGVLKIGTLSKKHKSDTEADIRL